MSKTMIELDLGVHLPVGVWLILLNTGDESRPSAMAKLNAAVNKAIEGLPPALLADEARQWAEATIQGKRLTGSRTALQGPILEQRLQRCGK